MKIELLNVRGTMIKKWYSIDKRMPRLVKRTMEILFRVTVAGTKEACRDGNQDQQEITWGASSLPPSIWLTVLEWARKHGRYRHVPDHFNSPSVSLARESSLLYNGKRDIFHAPLMTPRAFEACCCRAALKRAFSNCRSTKGTKPG